MPQIKKLVLSLVISFATSSSPMVLADVSINPNRSIEPEITEANAEFVYKYLLGEIAGQRGEISLSSQLFLDLAKKTRDPRLAERAARSAAYGRQQILALKAVTLWTELDPNSTEAMQASSQMLIANGDLESATPYIKKLLAKEDMRANGFLYLFDLIKKQEDKNQVFDTIKELAAPYPNSPEAHFSLAQAAWHADRKEMAFSELNTAETLRPGWETSAQMHARILYNESPEKSIIFYKNFLEKYPSANDIRMSYAKVLVEQNLHAEAKPQFIKLMANANGNPNISALVGLLSLETKDYALAKKYLLQALGENFKDPEQIYIYLGRTEEQNENYLKALEWYKKVGKGQHYLNGKISAASVIARMKGVDAAIKMLDEVDDLSFEQQVIMIQTQAGLLSEVNRNQESFDLMEKAVKNTKNTPELLYDFAMAAERVSKLDLMEEQLRKVIKLQPDYAAAYNALGYSYADRDINLIEAKTLIETALKLSPGDHYMLDSLGWVEYRLGNLEVAAAHLRKAYAIKTDPEIAAHLGEVLWHQGQQEEAEKIWANALNEFPDNDILVSTKNKFKS